MSRTQFNISMILPGPANELLLVNNAGTALEFTTGLPDGTTAATQAPLDDSTLVATTEYVDDAVAAAAGGLIAADFVYGEVPTGAIDGLNDTFTLNFTPLVNTLQVYIDGMRYQDTVDYSLAVATLTLVTPPATGQVLLVDYIR